jgi:hypothetical protein
MEASGILKVNYQELHVDKVNWLTLDGNVG